MVGAGLGAAGPGEGRGAGSSGRRRDRERGSSGALCVPFAHTPSICLLDSRLPPSVTRVRAWSRAPAAVRPPYSGCCMFFYLGVDPKVFNVPINVSLWKYCLLSVYVYFSASTFLLSTLKYLHNKFES